MKKILLSLVMLLLLVTGCGKNSETSIINDLEKKVNKSDAYKVSGELEIVNNDEVYTYDIEVSYKKENNYKVSLTNQANNHTQIILKNADGVYVLTPALNKSFKFQSDWPYNNSQVYLLQTLLKDINNGEYTYKETNEGYTFTTNVTYSNDKNLVKQDINFGKNYLIKSVYVYDKNESIKMKMVFNNVDMNKNYDTNYFTLEENMKDAKKDNEVASLKDVVYPMYVPSDTYLTNKETIDTNNGKRIISFQCNR